MKISNSMSDDSIALGISLPRKIVKKIDIERNDISRSRYLLRLIEKAYSVENPINTEKLSQAASRDGHSSQPAKGDTKAALESDPHQ
jgi:hypothetical protein